MRHVVWALLILLVGIRFLSSRPVYNNNDKIRVSGTVYSDPIKYTGNQAVKIAGLTAYIPLFPEVYYGDGVILDGYVMGGKLDKAKLIHIDEKVGVVSRIRKRIIKFYEESLPQPMSGLIGGITLGARGGLTGEFYQRTKLAGLTHVVVASGTNITFVISFLFSLLSLVAERRKLIVFVTLGVIFYLFISGFDAPLVRAAIMAGLVFFAESSGRIATPWRVLFISALCMLVVNPDWLTDVGFALSFASTASIMAFKRKMEVLFGRLPVFVNEGLSTTISAQIGVSPILFVVFGGISIWSPLTNLLTLWTIPIIMMFGTLAAFLSFILVPLGRVVLYLSYPCLWWFVTVVNLFT